MTIDIVRAALFTPISGGAWGLPLLLQAEPGCGKTSLLKALARDGGVPCRVLSPGTDGEGAFGVVPVPEKGRITYPAPEWLDLFGNTGAGMVLVDEVTTAGPMLQASIMGLLTERRIGAARLPNRVRVIGACNPVQTAAGGYELSPPLANRFGHLAWPACSVDHMASVWGAMVEDSFSTDVPSYDADLDRWAAREEEVKKLWPEAFANAVALVSGFLRAQPQMKNACPDPSSGFAAGPWPSDRTWEYAIRALASSKIHGLSDADESRFVRGFIGDDAFIGFAEFRRHLDLPDVAALLDGEITFKPTPARLDRTAAVITAAATMVAAKDSSTARVDAIWGFLPLWTEGARDIAIPAMRQLVAAKKTSKKPSAIKFLADINPLLQVAK